MRKDAEANRDRIIDAARVTFGERGLNAPMEDIAQQAGVGIATLYRRFATREALIGCVFEKKMAAYASAAEQALSDPDPWEGFCSFVMHAFQMQADDQGFTDVLTMTFPTSPEMEQFRNDSYRDFARLISRAKRVGRLRRDFVAEDMVIFLMANAGVVAACANDAPDAWRRFAAYLLQSLDSSAAARLPAAPTREQTYQAMLRS